MHVLLVEDHPLYSKALGEELIQSFPDMVLTIVQTIAAVFSALQNTPSLARRDNAGALSRRDSGVDLPIVLKSQMGKA